MEILKRLRTSSCVRGLKHLAARVSGLPGFWMWASICVHVVALTLASFMKGAQPSAEKAQSISLGLETSPPPPLVSTPMELDLSEFAGPPQPAPEPEELPAWQLEEPIVSLEIAEALPHVEVRVPLIVMRSPGNTPAPEEPQTHDTPPTVEFLAGVNRPPAYPMLARRLGYQGTALLELEVLADGTTGAVQILESTGFKILDDAAVSAAKTWRFTPPQRSSPVRVVVPVVFKLR